MSAIAETFDADDRLAKRNALVLSIAQALAGGNNTVIAATAGIIGSMLAPDRGLATLPVPVMVVASGSARFRSAIWRGISAAVSHCRPDRWWGRSRG